MFNKFTMKRVAMGVLIVGILAVTQQPVGAGQPMEADQFRTMSSCVQCDLAGASFDLESHAGAMLGGASLYGTSLIGVDLSYADLSNANLGLAVLVGANLIGANLSGADLSRADLTGADLTGADLTGVVTDVNTTCPDASSGPCSF